MRRTAALVLCLLLLSGCGSKAEVMPHGENPVSDPDQPENIWMEVTECSPTDLSYVIHNQSEYLVDYDPGFYYSLQVEDGGDWYYVTDTKMYSVKGECEISPNTT